MVVSVKSRVERPELVERRRAQIVGAATELFGRHGYHPATIRDIAKRAEVSIGLIYQYVEDKEDVLYLAIWQVLDSYRREIPKAIEGIGDPLQRFCTAIGAYCRVVDANRPATVLAYRETKSLRRERRQTIKEMELGTNELIAACVRDCIAGGLFRQVNVDLFTYQIVMLTHSWALKHWHFGPRMALEDYIGDSLELMLGPVLTEAGQRELYKGEKK